MDVQAAKALCRGFAGAIESIKWGNDTVFSVGDKMFACAANDAGVRSISFKVEDERFLELTDRPGIVPAPYLARAKWIRVEDLSTLPPDEASALLRRSYELVFARLTKKLQRELGAGE